jgi:hypothetical protein
LSAPIDVERELAVRRLIDVYARACDTNDVDLVVSLFARGGRLLVGDDARSGEQLRAFYQRRFDRPTLHFVTGLTIEERAADVVSCCRFLAVEMPPTGTRLVAGRYDDVIAIENGDARFRSRRITVDRRMSIDRAFVEEAFS